MFLFWNSPALKIENEGMAIVLAVAGHLTWLASYSNFYSVLTVVICFILMVIFILRLNGENIFMHPRVLHYVNNVTPEKAVVNIRNPFCVKIKTEAENSLKNGVELEFSLLKSSELYILWGVSVPEFYQSVVYPWQDIVNSLKDLNWLNDHTIHLTHYGRLAKSSNITLHIATPEYVTEEKLGQLPRGTYPLVLVNTLSEDHDEQNVVAVFTVIHLKDNICKLDTQIVSQFIKTRNNQVHSLQPLFVTASKAQELPKTSEENRTETQNADDEDGVNTQHSTETGSRRSSCERSEICDDYDDCIVCQSVPITYALLPCRHACVCHVCLKKIGDRCPMCRGMIEMYFRVNGTDSRRNSSDSISGSRSDLSEHVSETRWQRINRRLNEFLGFL